MIMADNGSSLYITGTPDSRWNNDDLGNLHQVTASDFDVLLISPLYTPQNVPTGPNPTINSFSATSSSGPGQPVTLRWNETNGEYNIVSPSVGAIRGPPSCESDGNDDLHAVCHQPVWSQHAQVIVTVP